MKTLEQVKNYLSVEGMNDKDIHKVIGFLYAEGDFVLGTPLKYKISRNTFLNFVNWYEEENNVFDGLFELKTDIEDLWTNIQDRILSILSTEEPFNVNSFDLCKHQQAIEYSKLTIESIEKVLCKMQKILEGMEDEKAEDKQEKEVK